MECIADTNILIYDTIEDSEFHQKVSETLDLMDNVMVPSIVLEEFVHAMKQIKVGEDIIRKKSIEILDTYAIIPISAINMKDSIRILSEENVSFKRFNDKLILSVAKEKNLPLFTFDKELISECKANGVKTIL
jgi:hypothetical protein